MCLSSDIIIVVVVVVIVTVLEKQCLNFKIDASDSVASAFRSGRGTYQMRCMKSC